MTAEEAAAHIGNPVLAHDGHRLHEGEIVAGPDGRGLVCVWLTKQGQSPPVGSTQPGALRDNRRHQVDQ